MEKEVILKRKAYMKLSEWKAKYAPDYALFLKGARCVGKTTLAETFARKEYRSYIKVNFQEASPSIMDLFANGLTDFDYLFGVLQMEYKTTLFDRESLIILDDIQFFPLARQALKALLEDKRYDYIETGSLASITKKSKESEILIPSEEYCAESNETTLEIGFLIRDGRKVIPIEVKSSKSFTVKSLTKFKTKFSNKIGLQYVLYEGDVKKEGEVVYLPYYMASVL